MQETLHHVPDDILDAPPKSRSTLPTFSLANPLPDPVPAFQQSQAHKGASSSHAAPACSQTPASSHTAANGQLQHDRRQASQASSAESPSRVLTAGTAAGHAGHDPLPGHVVDTGQQPSATDRAAGRAGAALAAPLAHAASQAAADEAGPQQSSRSGQIDESSHQAAHAGTSPAGLDPSHPHQDINGSIVEQAHALTGSRPAPDDAGSLLQPPLQDGIEPAQDGSAGTASQEDTLLQHARALREQGREGCAAAGHELQPQNWQAGVAQQGGQDVGALQGGTEEQQVHKKARACSAHEAVAA